jgi:hypothetical protein
MLSTAASASATVGRCVRGWSWKSFPARRRCVVMVHSNQYIISTADCKTHTSQDTFVQTHYWKGHRDGTLPDYRFTLPGIEQIGKGIHSRSIRDWLSEQLCHEGESTRRCTESNDWPTKERFPVQETTASVSIKHPQAYLHISATKRMQEARRADHTTPCRWWRRSPRGCQPGSVFLRFETRLDTSMFLHPRNVPVLHLVNIRHKAGGSAGNTTADPHCAPSRRWVKNESRAEPVAPRFLQRFRFLLLRSPQGSIRKAPDLPTMSSMLLVMSRTPHA